MFCMDDASLIDALRLALVDGVGPITRQALVAKFGSPTAVFAAAPSELRLVDGIGPKTLTNLLQARHSDAAEKELARCREQNVKVVTREDAGYPRPLNTIPDPPGVLFLRGDVIEQDALSVAIVGTRHASPYGIRHAERFAAALARAGYTIVSRPGAASTRRPIAARWRRRKNAGGARQRRVEHVSARA